MEKSDNEEPKKKDKTEREIKTEQGKEASVGPICYMYMYRVSDGFFFLFISRENKHTCTWIWRTCTCTEFAFESFILGCCCIRFIFIFIKISKNVMRARPQEERFHYILLLRDIF